MSKSLLSKTRKPAIYGAALAGIAMMDTPAIAAINYLNIGNSVIPFVGTGSYGLSVWFLDGVTTIGGIYQFNDGLGRTLNNVAMNAILGPVGYGSPITVGNPGFTGGIMAPTSVTGVYTFGFRTTANQTGWVQIDFGVPGGPVTYLAAAYRDEPGGMILAGTNVPEPAANAALAGLAALAAGVVYRKRRKQKA